MLRHVPTECCTIFIVNKYLQLNRLIVFFIATGFFVLAFEIYLEHHNILNDKKLSWIPVIFGITGGIITLLITLLFDRISYYLFFVVMIVSIFVGSCGLYLHNAWRFPAFADFLFHKKPFNFEILTQLTPFLAPSAFIAIGGLGILVAVFNSWGKR